MQPGFWPPSKAFLGQNRKILKHLRSVNRPSLDEKKGILRCRNVYLSRVTEQTPTPRIFLVDADAFFVAVARLVDPEGAGKASLLLVGGTAEGRGVVCSASYEARQFGVRSAMPMSRALRLCPGAMCVPVPGKECSQKHRDIRAVLERFSPVVQSASIDEWYLDLGGTEVLYEGAPLDTLGQRIRSAVIAETSMTVSIGGGTSKLIAKLAAERAKPKPDSGANGVRVVPAGGELEFMRQLMLADIPGIGPKTTARLAERGLRSVEDVLALDEPALSRLVGPRDAGWLAARVRGADSGHVSDREGAKSISRDDTFPVDINDDVMLEGELTELVGRAAGDLRSDGLTARTITVRIRDRDFTTRQASRTVDQGVESDRAIFAVARELLHKLRKQRRVPARLLGVGLSSFKAPSTTQLALFDQLRRPLETEKDREVSRAMDAVREKFGRRAIAPGRKR